MLSSASDVGRDGCSRRCADMKSDWQTLRWTGVIVAALVVATTLGCATRSVQPTETSPPAIGAPYKLRSNPKFLGMTFETVLGNGTSEVPFDKHWEELTTDEQRIIRGRSPNLRPTDEPPYPAGGLAALMDPIAQGIGSTLNGEGAYEGKVLVDKDGVAQTVTLVRAPHVRTARFIGQVALLTKFKPGKCDGTPCEMVYVLRVRLKVD
jgi:hypothetical protein